MQVLQHYTGTVFGNIVVSDNGILKWQDNILPEIADGNYTILYVCNFQI